MAAAMLPLFCVSFHWKKCKILGLFKELGKNSIPVGYETIVTMCPLDFEEFLWANGIGQEAIEAVRNCYLEEKPVPEGIHYAFKQLFYRYIIVGGLPAAVNCFFETNHIGEVAKVYDSILDEYRMTSHLNKSSIVTVA